MSHTTDPVAQLRGMSTSKLIQLGEESLRNHLVAQAVVAHQKHSGLSFEGLDILLTDPECLRHPTRLVFEFGEMAMHQFAQPDLDHRNQEQEGRVLYVRPILRQHPNLVVLAVAYMIPVINYGDVVSDEHCLLYGATLLGMMAEEFYQKICHLADVVGAEVRLAGSSGARVQPDDVALRVFEHCDEARFADGHAGF